MIKENEIYRKILDGIYRYGTTKENAFRGQIPISSELIRESVVIAPYWRPAMFMDSFDSAEMLLDDRVWDVTAGEMKFTYLRTEIGAPRIGDTTLALGLSNCKKALFIGSVGALSSEMNIGDLIIPEFSVTGDGYSRYLTEGMLQEHDCFTSKSTPDSVFTKNLRDITESLADTYDFKFHTGQVFSIDTIFAQFGHIDEILGYGCNCIEMETAAFFKAASIAGIKASALLQVSDNTVNNKSLYSGRTKEDHDYRWKVRKYIYPKVMKMLFGG